MKKAVLVKEKTFEVEEKPLPVPGYGEVLIKVNACGVCGSDLHMFHGNHPVLRPPLEMGHEIAGKIIEVGTGVNNYQVGEDVIVFPLAGCGSCERCLEENHHLCEKQKVIGAHLSGGFAEYLVISVHQLLKLPKQLTPIEGAMIEPAAVAVHTVRRLGNVNGANIAVLGVGPIGQLVAQVLKAEGAKCVIVSDPVQYRLDLAEKLGADIMVNPIEVKDIPTLTKESVHPLGLDAVIDCAGKEQSLRMAFELTRRGGKIVVCAVFSHDVPIPLTLLQRGERDLLGIHMYEKRDFERALELVIDGKIQLPPLVTHQYPLQNIQQAFEMAQRTSEQVGKVMVLP
jgi:L-iditol 2-dehydrogenase